MMGKGLAEDQFGLIIKPQKSICCIKTNYVIIKPDR